MTGETNESNKKEDTGKSNIRKWGKTSEEMKEGKKEEKLTLNIKIINEGVARNDGIEIWRYSLGAQEEILIKEWIKIMKGLK